MPRAAAGLSALSAETALEQYVAKPDAAYAWSLHGKLAAPACTSYVLRLISQEWQTGREVDHPVWRHWLIVHVPKEIRAATAMLWIGGGQADDPPPAEPDARMVSLATSAGSVVVQLRAVPNQPLTFANEGAPRVEDDLVAFSWARFLASGDPTWPVQLPMVKSAVRAMDAVQAFLRTLLGRQEVVTGFVVVGASKRGWAAWLTAAIDPRVVGVIPIVVDVLNVEATMRHHRAVYGGWGPAVADYVAHGVPEHLGTAACQALWRIIDPYTYRARLTMPKYIVCAAGDAFFPPDSWRYSLMGLPGETHVRYVPNVDHALAGSDVFEAVGVFYELIAASIPRPRYTWSIGADDILRVHASDRPARVRLWRARNANARDFRFETIGAAWASARMAEESPGVYEARIISPDDGVDAFLIEMEYADGLRRPLTFTTGVYVLPGRLHAAAVSAPVADVEAAPHRPSPPAATMPAPGRTGPARR